MSLLQTLIVSAFIALTGMQANASTDTDLDLIEVAENGHQDLNQVTIADLEARISRLEAVLANIDADNDSFSPNDGDCDDSSSEIHPAMKESQIGFDGIDNDCDGVVDEDDYYESDFDDNESRNDDDFDDSYDSDSHDNGYSSDNHDKDEHEVKGTIISITGSQLIIQATKIEGFRISGNVVVVDVSNARFKHGSYANLALSRFVEVEGTWNGTVLVAQKVEFDD